MIKEVSKNLERRKERNMIIIIIIIIIIIKITITITITTKIIIITMTIKISKICFKYVLETKPCLCNVLGVIGTP